MAPSWFPGGGPFVGNRPGVLIRALRGQRWTRLAFSPCAQELPQRRHGRLARSHRLRPISAKRPHRSHWSRPPASALTSGTLLRADPRALKPANQQRKPEPRHGRAPPLGSVHLAICLTCVRAANGGGTHAPSRRRIPRTTSNSPSPARTSTKSSRPRCLIRSLIAIRARTASPGATAVRTTGSHAGVDARTTSTAMTTARPARSRLLEAISFAAGTTTDPEQTASKGSAGAVRLLRHD
jgi:hypothetical protein